MTNDLAAIVPAVAFWIFVAIVVVAGVASAAFRHQETQKTIRQAIESGQKLDPETLDRILQSGRPKGPPPRNFFLVAGVMMLAIAAGLVAIGVATSQTNPAQLYPGLGAGAMVGCLGLGLLVAGRLIGKPSGNGQG
jgi:hypothetical protein